MKVRLKKLMASGIQGLAIAAATLAVAAGGVAEEQKPRQVLFTDVNVFDGKSEELQMGVNVLVEDNIITSVGAQTTAADGAAWPYAAAGSKPGAITGERRRTSSKPIEIDGKVQISRQAHPLKR